MGKCILAGHPPVGGIGFGTYTGDGAASRTVSLGVTPKWVLVLAYGTYSSNGFAANGDSSGGLAVTGQDAGYYPSVGHFFSSVSICDGGFVVYKSTSVAVDSNNSGTPFNYIYGT